MFKLRCSARTRGVEYTIGGKGNANEYLHSNGSVFDTPEYFPTKEDAQVVLDKFQPKHEWKHGDVFKGQWGTHMIYLNIVGTTLIYCLGDCSFNHPIDTLNNAKFLFNIKEKL